MVFTIFEIIIFYIEKLILWQNSRKAYQKQFITLSNIVSDILKILKSAVRKFLENSNLTFIVMYAQ